MPAVQYPFIDIAVHPRIRERFARGEAMALFSIGLDRVLWANGAGADLFGHPAIYDFIEQGPKQGDVSFRQVASTARQLAAIGDTRSFLIRIAAGFQRVVVNATVELVRIHAGEEAVLFSCPVSSKALDTAESARRMLEGFDDPDTHMAVIGQGGEIIASSAGFQALGITPQTASMLVTRAGVQPERMIKRPIPTGQGYLPAAIGRLSDSPALHLLFVVEMVIGHLDPVENGVSAAAVEAAAATILTPVHSAEVTAASVTEPATAEATEPLSAVMPDAEVDSQALTARDKEHISGIPPEAADEISSAALADVPTEELAPVLSHEAGAPASIPDIARPVVTTEEEIARETADDAASAAHMLQPAADDHEVTAVLKAEGEASEGARAGMLDAISAASLPSEAVVAEHRIEGTEVHHHPEAVIVSAESAAPDMLAAIPADHLPAEAATIGEPAADISTGHTDVHDLHEEATGLILAHEPASVEDAYSQLVTGYLPPVIGGTPSDYTTAALEHAPQTATYLREEEASDMPAVQAADLIHELDSDAPVSDALQTSDIAAKPTHEPDKGDGAIAAGDASVETDYHSSDKAIEPATAASTVNTDSAFTAMIDAVAEIEDVDDLPEEITEEASQPSSVAHDAVMAETEEEHVEQPTDEPAHAHPLDIVQAAEPTVLSTGDFTAEHEAHDATTATDEADAAVTEAEEPAIQEAAAYSAETPFEPTPDQPAVAGETKNPAETEIAAEQPAETATTPEDPDTGFVFNRNGRATRFVWKIDAAGRFSEISREFAEAVGPHATSVAGVAFTDIAALFNLDPDGRIAELLARRDTWSGRTIHWPVEGTTLTVPVDLAALPTYTRSREFDGFRGFGVVRLSDAAEDPMKIGLTLGHDAAKPEAKEVTPETEESAEALPFENPPEAESSAEDAEPFASPEIADGEEPLHAAELPGSEAEEPELPFNGEPPALKIVETPGRRLSDKIVQLHQHRLSISDSLSPSEQAAFREIAKQLEPFGKREERRPEQIDETAVSKPESDEATADHHAVNAAGADIVEEASIAHVAANDDNKGVQDLPPAESSEKVDAEFDPLAALNTAIPPRSKMTDGLSAEIVDQLPVAVLVHAGDTLIHANPEFLRLTGYKDLAEVEGVGGLDALLQRHDLQGKTERPGAMVVVRADDVLVPVTARLQSIRWEDSSALMLALMPVEKDSEAPDAASRSELRDETRPDRMLEKVAKLQVEVEELQSILETATDGVAIIGPEGDIRSMNRSASALFNYDEQETRGKPFVMLFAHESQKAVLDYLAGLTGNGVASVLNDGREVIGREASGGFVPLFMTMGVLTSSNGYCAVIRDITQWKRTEEELRNAKRAAETANAHKSDFLARVSHEIRTPLNAIIGFSDMMASERLGPIGHARYVEYAGDIGRSGRHVLDIVNDLLDISKIEAGEMELEFGSVGLNAAIAEAVSIVQPQANGQRVIIRTALAQSVPNVVADLRSIKQIALNILSNAIRFTPSGGQIVVSTSYEGNGSVVLRIRDTGVGMTRTELEQAMKPFRQVATNSRQRGDGTGLGLPLTKAMVDANRALFAIHSAPNEGTLVEVTFPSQRVLAN